MQETGKPSALGKKTHEATKVSSAGAEIHNQKHQQSGFSSVFPSWNHGVLLLHRLCDLQTVSAVEPTGTQEVRVCLT